MKKTTTINLAGLVYHIEEEGYKILQQYFDDIKRIFSKQEGVEEMITDIEARFAELFQERLSTFKEVVTYEDVEAVIAIMGKPNELDEDMDEDTSESHQENERFSSSNKRLYRDTDEGIIGGVSAGTAHYFNIDPVIIRVLWIVFVLLGGSGILIYIIAWIAIPSAKTTSEKLQMRGQSVNFDTIKGYAENFGNEAKRGFNKAASTVKDSMKQGSNAVSRLGNAFLRVVGFFILLTGIFSLTSLSMGFFIKYSNFLSNANIRINDNVVNTDVHTLVNVFFIDQVYAFWTIFFLILIPVLFLIILGVKLLFNQKFKMRILSLTLLGIWIIAIVSVVFLSINSGLDFKEKYKTEKQVTLIEDYEQISLHFFEDDIRIENNIDSDFDDYFAISDDHVKLGYVNVQVVPTRDSLFYYTVERSSHGGTLKSAKKRADEIQFEIERQDSVLNIPIRYSFLKEDKFRGQKIKVKVYVPQDKVIVLNGNLEDYPIDVHSEKKISKDRFEQTSSWRAEGNSMKQVD